MTPTMEEIAGWLREAAGDHALRASFSKTASGALTHQAKEKEARDRSAQVEAMGWRPIEDAPRTGEEVDLWDDFAQDRITDCKWMKNAWHRWEPNSFETMEWCRVHGKLTHFMRKPQPPVKK